MVILKPEYKNGLPVTKSLLENFNVVTSLIRKGVALSVYTPCYGGVAEAVLKMAIGNQIGFNYYKSVKVEDMFAYSYGSFVIELSGDENVGELLGYTTSEKAISYGDEKLEISTLQKAYEDKLEPVFACNIKNKLQTASNFASDKQSTLKCNIKVAKPKVLIPVFPGTNCEFDTAKAFEDAGANADIFVIKNLSADAVSKSVEEFAKKASESQIIFVPGGFSGGDEPDGSGKFITAFFRNGAVKEEVTKLLSERDGLMGGICNGFQALIKLGLVPYGKIIDTDETCPTLTYNDIGRHQSRIVRVKVASTNSPWLSGVKVGDIYNVPISHGEGKFIASDSLIKELASNGQIMTQYVDFDGNATMDIAFNPNGSYSAIEGILSPDGRVFGKMGHSERIDKDLYKNVEGNFDIGMFDSAVKYYK